MYQIQKVQKKNKEKKKALKAQGSIEYISMIALALILVAIALAVIFLLGSKTTSGVKVSGTIEGAEYASTSTGNVILAIALSEPVGSYNSIAAINGNTSKSGSISGGDNFTVGGSYEYETTVTSSLTGNTLSSITFSNSAGAKETFLTSTGKPITVTASSTYPFTPTTGLSSS